VFVAAMSLSRLHVSSSELRNIVIELDLYVCLVVFALPMSLNELQMSFDALRHIVSVMKLFVGQAIVLQYISCLGELS